MIAPRKADSGFWSRAAGFAFTLLLAVAAVYLWLEHRGHGGHGPRVGNER